MTKGPFDFISPTHQPPQKQAAFDQFEATELYCPKCRQAVPVRKFLLLVLPEGEKYEYRCQYCGGTVGDKIDRSGQPFGILKT
ncbi:MAG: cytoplasmic protein [Deltaproteobacteria bacterium]|nr:cytoplasmic protein [Deltaproteobacteria bacterium]